MRLFESIIDANHRAVAGDTNAGLRPDDFTDSLPIAALTCIDPRLNAYFPNALAVPTEQFIWLRNAGNIITSTLSSTMRSLALACAVKGAREIAVIGHSDCQITRTTTMQILDRLKALGVDRGHLPENISDFFGTFGSERQNVIKACDLIRNSPLIGPRIPVHGLLLDLETGRLEWVVNGYEVMQNRFPGGLPGNVPLPKPGDHMEAIGSFKDFAMGEMKFPELKIGELASQIGGRLAHEITEIGHQVQQKAVPMSESIAEKVVEQVQQFAEKKWSQTQNQPPSLRMKPSPLPPKKRPPPIRPSEFKRG